MVGFVVAMPNEAKPLIEKYGMDETTCWGRRVYRLDIHGVEATLIVSGIGKVNAAFATACLISLYEVTEVINFGVSGGIGEGFSIGDIVVASACVQHDVDTSPLGDPKGFVSTVDTVFFPSDERLVSLFSEIIGAKVCIAASGEQFVADKDKKKAIVEDFGAGMCDMESGAVAQCAMIARLPYLSIRCLSDLADGSASQDFPTFVKSASEKLCTAIADVLQVAKKRGLIA